MLEFFREWGYTIQTAYIIMYVIGMTIWMIKESIYGERDEQIHSGVHRTEGD